MGPRMSSNYHHMGVSFGGGLHAAGVPLSGTLSFESSGGSGALLVSRNPVQRHLLCHEGVLKAYFKRHRRFIFETFGHAEGLDLDDLVLIRGQDCTSDWAVAVTLDSSAGSRVEFEIFTAAKAGVWGGWKTSCSASQRGPYRDSEAEQNAKEVHPMDIESMLEVPGTSDEQPEPAFPGKMSASVDVGGDNTLTLNTDFASHDEPLTGRQSTNGATPRMPAWRWPKHNDYTAIDQTIVLRRIQAKSRFPLPSKLQAAAGPAKDGWGRRDDDETDEKVTLRPWDPLDAVLRYILARGGASVTYALASDDDAIRLIREATGAGEMLKTSIKESSSWMEERMWEVADRLAEIAVDEDGVATIGFRTPYLITLFGAPTSHSQNIAQVSDPPRTTFIPSWRSAKARSRRAPRLQSVLC